ncbi:hypothetical protein Q5752_007087 [Cryptotrichosporon argae]
MSDLEAYEKDTGTAVVVDADATAEYAEYLRLAEVFQGERLAQLTRKLDWRVLPQLIFIYLLSYADRSNVSNAKLYSAQTDMGMTSTQWNAGLSVFFITYALGGPFSNMALKRLGPKRVLPVILLCVSFVLIGSGCCSNYVLGLFESGMFPGCSYTLTLWYTPAQLHSRYTIYYSGASLAGAFSGLLAYGIGHLDGTWGYHGWRFIYVIEGVFTTVIALGACFVLYDTPAKVGKWLSDDEKRFLVLRNEFEYGGANAAGADETFNWAAARQAWRSWHAYVLAFTFFSVGVAVYGYSFVLPTVILNMGFTAANAQLLSCPPYVFACLCVLASGWYSDRYRRRMLATVIPSSIAFVGLLIAILTVQHKTLVPLTYIAVCLATGGLYCLSPCVAVWISLNQAGQMKRAMSVAVTIVFSQFGGLVGSNIYLASEAPGYPLGFGLSLGFLGLGCIVVPIIYWYLLGRINAARDAMSHDEIYEKYTIDELQDMGDLSPLYRYER